MKPKTKLEKKIVELSKSLPKISKAQIEYYKNKINNPVGYRRKKGTTFCLECGHTFESEDTVLFTCPNCGKKLEIINTKKKYYKSSAKYYSIITTKNDYQVVRHFWVEVFKEIKEPARYFISEVVQNWIAPDGKIKMMAKSKNPMPSYYENWQHTSDLEIRRENNYHYNYYYTNPYRINPYYIYPKIIVTAKIKRNGFANNFYEITPCDFFSELITNSKFETLLKTKQIGLLKYFLRHNNFTEYWDSVKICIRNNYLVEDANMWYDHMKLLKKFNKDLRNPKYVCPYNLQYEHQILIEKNAKKEEKEKLLRELENIRREEDEYKKSKGKFFGVCISNDNIIISVLDSVKAVAEEGIAMHHCVYKAGYYRRENCLLLSARDKENNRLETIELSLQDYSIQQSRGLQNKYTEYHEEIINLLNENMQVIRKLNKKAA